MRSWTGQGTWNRWSIGLGNSAGEDFLRKAMPFLRLFWPTAHITPKEGPWRSRGVDILATDDAGDLICGIWCLGFQEIELGEEHIREAVAAIRAFRDSDITLPHYVLVHNRDGRNRTFYKEIQRELEGLVSSGKAGQAELWDRQTFLTHAFNRMMEILNESLRGHSDSLLRHFQSLFEFSASHIAEVPVLEKRLTFKRDEHCSVEEVHPMRVQDISRGLLSTEALWTLLSGSFGTGKTTASLHAAVSSERIIIFVPCAMLSPSELQTSTNQFLEEVIRSLGILDRFDEEDRKTLHDISGAVLAYLLRHPESPYTLILDGLDENSAFTHLSGLQLLNNQLAEVSCPIIMTTRSEHLNSMFGDFNVAFHEFSAKWGRRQARLLELGTWDKEQVARRVEQAIKQTSGERRENLHSFMELLQNEAYADVYRDLPFYPLFLQFILEDVAEHGIRPADRCLLLRSWIARKIRRDRTTWVPGTVTQRVTIDGAMDTEAFIGKAIILLENTANEMTRKTGRSYELLESIDAAFLEGEAKKLFTVSADPILPILLNSVLVAPTERRGARLRVAFALRVFQEYFLASYLVRNGHSSNGYPEAVRSFYFELKGLSPEATGHDRRIRPVLGKKGEIARRLSRNKSLLRKAGYPEEQVEEMFWKDRSEWRKDALLKVRALEAEAARKSRARTKNKSRRKTT